jgi:hypothetical protein
MVTISKTASLPVAAWGGATSTVCEPTAAQLGRNLLVTGNWYAGVSADGGATWAHVSPYTFFQSASGGFCCDQTTVAASSRGLMAWVLQYSKDTAAKENTLRLAVNTDGNLESGIWDLYDLTPTVVDSGWTNEWFDYNHIAISNDFLYIVTNMFNFADVFTRCVVFRFSLDELRDGSVTDFDLFIAPEEYFSLRATEGAKDEMYFFAHKSTGTMTVFRWPETTDAPTSFDVNITRWRRGQLTSMTPDGSNWLRRGDGRITGAWAADGRIGALWMSNTLSDRPNPFIRALVIDPQAQALVGEPNLWSSDFALGYPTVGVNAAGAMGVAFFYGGGTRSVNHAVGTLDTATQAWSLRRAVAGTNGPADDKWGDYQSCRPDPDNRNGWLASGFTLDGGQERSDIQPHLVYFN